MTSLSLYVQAGGRCEFDGCNKYLLEHDPTEIAGNFAEQAHIYAFSADGPRGHVSGRPDDINDLANLILLCPECHHLVDAVRPNDYSVEALKRFKRDHENRIFSLTELSADRDTVPIVVKGLICGRPVDISDEEMQAAVVPNHLKQRQRISIDLTTIPDSPDEAFWTTAARTIDLHIAQLYGLSPQPGRTLRVSVFALAPIPLLVYLGSKLSDKMAVDLYQRHRDPESWSWQEGPGAALYSTQCIGERPSGGPVSLLLNLSGTNRSDTIPGSLRNRGSVYELTLVGQDPSPLFLRTRGDLDRFTHEYIRFLATIRQAHPGIDVIHVFPAIPAPVAITLGRARLPKVDPVLEVYDHDARAGGFVPTLEIT